MRKIFHKRIKIAPKNSNRMHLPSSGAVDVRYHSHHLHNGSTILGNSNTNSNNLNNNICSNINSNNWNSNITVKGGMLEEQPPGSNNNSASDISSNINSNNSNSSSALTESFLRWLQPNVDRAKDEFPGELGETDQS